MTPDNQSLLGDAQAAVRIASDALAADNVDLAVAVFAGFLVVAQRLSSALTEASKLLDRRIDLSMAQYTAAAADRFEAHSRAMVEGLHESVALEHALARPEPVAADDPGDDVAPDPDRMRAELKPMAPDGEGEP